MEEIQIKENTFRIKPMNAIELLALRSQISFDDFEQATKLYSLLLEKLEVKLNDQWLPVKEKGKNIFYPNGLENNMDLVNKLLDYFLEYLKSVF